MITTTEWMIDGHELRGWGRLVPIRRFAGGRSRKKLERMAAEMNASGDYRVRVRLALFRWHKRER